MEVARGINLQKEKVYKKKAVILQAHENFPDFRSARQIKLLDQQGYEIHAIVWNRSGIRKFIDEATVANLHTIDLPCEHGLGARELFNLMPRFWLRVIAKLFRLTPYVIIANNLDTAIPSCVFSFFGRAKVIFDSREPYHAVFRQKINNKFFERLGWRLDQLVAKMCTHVIAVTPKMMDMYKQMGVTATFIPNAPKQSFFRSKKAYKKRGHIVVGFIGNLRADAGVLRMAKQLALYNAKSNQKFTFVLAGLQLSNFESDFVEIENLLKSKVSYKGLLNPSKISNLYDEIDITFQLPETNNLKFADYGLNVKIYEALASGVPVILSRTGENYDFLGENNGAIWVDTDKELFNALDRLSCAQQRQENGLAGVNFIKRTGHIWEKYETLYAKLIQKDQL